MNTDYHVSFPTPEGTLVAGPEMQEFRAYVYLEGAGVATGELFLYEAGVEITLLWDATVSGTEASPTLILGAWDATGLDPDDIEARFVGTDVSGGTAKLWAIEWNAQLEPAAPGLILLQGIVVAATDLEPQLLGPTLARGSTVATQQLEPVVVSPTELQGGTMRPTEIEIEIQPA